MKRTNSVRLNDKSFMKGDEFSIDFLPIVIPEKVRKETIARENHQEFEILFTLDPSFVTEETSHTMVPQTIETIDEIDWSSISQQNSTGSQRAENSTVNDPPEFSKNTSFSYVPDFLKVEDLEKMVLLELIANLGDCRELPLLYKLQHESTSQVVLERVDKLIQKFSFQSPGPKQLFHSKNTVTKSVFTAVLNQSDTETQLILLQDIMTIGDEKEIPLLKLLLNDPNKLIADKAIEALKHIQQKSTKKTICEIAWYDKILCNVDFELAIGKKLDSDKAYEGTTLFDQLCSMSTNLYCQTNE